jgi:hypothetical protein
MLTAGIYDVAVHALRLSGSLVSDNFTQRCAKPFLEGQVETLLVSRPSTKSVKLAPMSNKTLIGNSEIMHSFALMYDVTSAKDCERDEISRTNHISI